jgi:hypothetical protein
LNYRLDLEHWFVSLADVRTHHSLDSNYAALLSASTLRNQLVNRFQLPLFWSTNIARFEATVCSRHALEPERHIEPPHSASCPTRVGHRR